MAELNIWTSVLTTPFDANTFAGSFAAYGLGTDYQNVSNLGGGLNLGGTPFNNFTIIGTNEQGGVPSTDVWTAEPWVVLP